MSQSIANVTLERRKTYVKEALLKASKEASISATKSQKSSKIIINIAVVLNEILKIQIDIKRLLETSAVNKKGITSNGK